MKTTLAVTLSAMLLAQVLCVHVPRISVGNQPKSFITQEYIRPGYQTNRVGLDKCKVCIDFAEEALNTLLNIILQGGVVGGCQALCEAVASKTSPDIGTVCEILCDLVGIDEFVKILEKEDLDPIYYCELLSACPINDEGDAKFTRFEISPTSGPQGMFGIDYEYVSQNGTGTGEILLECLTVDHIPIATNFLHELADAGTYNGQFQLRAESDPDCDPTQGPCEEWLPGNYTVKIAICNGECGSKHPNSQIYDEASVGFTITENNNNS